MSTLAPERKTPYDWQERDIDDLLAADAHGFVVADPGAGKTLIGVETGLRSRHEVIVVLAAKPNHVRRVWKKTILEQDPTATVRVVDGSEPGKAAYADLELGFPGWYIMTHGYFSTRDRAATKKSAATQSLKAVQPDLTIVDEAHFMANAGNAGRDRAKSWKNLNNLKSKRFIFMSGTIVRNRFENFWGLLRVAYPERDEAYDIADVAPNRWISEWCATEADHFAPTGRKVVGELTPGRLANEIPVYIQHFKRQRCCEWHPEGFLADVPEPINIEVGVDLTPGQKRAIKQMEEDYVAWLADEAGNDRQYVTKLPIVVQTRLRQMTLGMPSIRHSKTRFDENGDPKDELYFEANCESPKLDAFHERLSETPGETWLVLTSSEVFAREAYRRIVAEWNVKAGLFTGKVPNRERDGALQDFMDGKIRVLVATIDSIGTGTDGIQHATSRLFWMDQSMDLTNNIQTESRADRRGQLNQVVNERAVAEGSMDEGIISSQLERRLALNKSLKRTKMRSAA